MKKIFLYLIFFLSTTAFSQSINDYQYVIVPIKFEFLKENDKYRLNTLTKLLLQKYNFKAYLSTDDIPLEILNNQCSYLSTSLVENNSLFMTNVKLVLKDCKDKVLFETEFGSSRNKELAAAYNEALRMTGKSFEKLNYGYNGKNGIAIVATTIVTPELGKSSESPNSLSSENPEIFYFAQPIANGYQIVNSEPRVIMRLFNTSQKDIYIGIKADIHGVVITKNGKWFFEYYENAILVSDPIKLKF